MLARDGIKRRRVFVSIDEQAVQAVVDSGLIRNFGARAVRRMLERESFSHWAMYWLPYPALEPALVHITEQDHRLNCTNTSFEQC